MKVRKLCTLFFKKSSNHFLTSTKNLVSEENGYKVFLNYVNGRLSSSTNLYNYIK
jgi:hypothetical protein